MAEGVGTLDTGEYRDASLGPAREPGAAESASCDLKQARILIIDDEESNLRILRRMLERAGYQYITEAQDPLRGLVLFGEQQPDLVCLDLHMPGLDGFGVLERLAATIPAETYLPILMLTGDSSPGVKQRALSLGAKDFVNKPFNSDEVRLRIHNLLVTRFMHLALARHNHLLELQVRERTLALEKSRLEVLERLARAAEFRDDATGRHTRRVGRIAAMLALNVGVAPAETELLERAAPLHDIGKIGIRDQILLKPGSLDAGEFAEMQRHTTIGAEILSGGATSLMQLAEEIARSHHERWDGSGYPAGLGGEQIPLAARIVAIADVFDALTHPRPYRPAWKLQDALDELRRLAGRSFDRRLVDAFLKLPHLELM